jgi:hypothetical protein
MNTKLVFAIIFIVCLVPAFGQRPSRPDGPPPGEGPRRPDWTHGVDTNKNGVVEADEFQSAIERTFAHIDANGDGVIDKAEAPDRPHFGHDGPGGPPPGFDRGRPGPPQGRPGADGFRPGGHPGPPEGDIDLLPPFFFDDKLEQGGSITKVDFERAAKETFAAMDANHDGVLSREESKPPHGPGGPPPPPNAMFIAAELRFGDKLVKNEPFSADIVIEDTRRLFDGSTVTKKMQGSIYRDAAGRTRREQPLEMVGGVTIDKPQTLVFINDFAADTQYFLDLNGKTARRNRIGHGGPPRDGDGPPDAKTESLGTKTIEGVIVEGTRTTFEIPAGELGNDTPIQVVTENWISPDLQMIVMSRHLDPLSGEHIFKMVNIRRVEPPASLFTVPPGFKIEGNK